MNSALVWFLLNLFSIMVMSFYSMMEMACVSFNKVRLHYYVSKGFKRAQWLNFLLQNPSRLFGTTLIGVNVALIVGSEFSRHAHIALGINPDLSPLTQVIIVVIFGELAPMFAARRYPEHVAMLGIPLIYASSKLMAPFIWSIGAISRIANKLVGGKEVGSNIFISRDELQKILEEQDPEHPTAQGQNQGLGQGKEDLNVVVSSIFSLREKEAAEMMKPLNSVQMLPSNSNVAQMSQILETTDQTFAPIYHQLMTNIVGIAVTRDLIRAPDNRKIRDFARTPWFITRNTKALQIVKQFRSNKQQVAIVLNETGQAVGILTLDDLLEEIFGKSQLSVDRLKRSRQRWLVVDRTFPGQTKIVDFNEQFKANLSGVDPEETLADLMARTLGHHPEKGESIYVEPFELTVKETSLLEVKSIVVKSRPF